MLTVFRQAVILFTAGLLLLAAAGCDQQLVEGDLGVDNRTEAALTIYLLASEPPAEDAGLSTVPAGVAMTIPGVDGCSRAGFEARDPGGNVIAELPPMDRHDHNCQFTWVISEDGSFIDR